MSIQRGHEAVVLLVDDGVLGINGAGFEDKNGLGILRQNGLVFVATVFQRLESDGFTRCTKAIANPNMTHSVVLKNKN